jgi:hypothetical protein
MIYILIWLALSALAFLALRHFALRDFDAITVGGLIGLILLSLLTPIGTMLALLLSLEGKGKFLGKVVWTKQ